MKKCKHFFLPLVLITFTVMNTQAQGFHLGVKAGANIFKIDGSSYDNEFKFGYNAGAFAEINFTSHLGIQPEVMFNQTNYRTSDHFSAIYPGGTDDLKGKLNYLTIPVLLNIRPVKLLSILVGPQFGILLNGDEHVTNSAKDAFKKGDFSMVGGLQLNLAALKVGARYVVGLTDINDLPDSEKWKNQGFQLYAGFRIF